MDPNFITAQDWAAIPAMLISLYAWVGMMTLFAFSLMLGHAVIPSLVGTRHLPPQAASSRPLFYGLAAIFFIIAILILLNLIVNLLGPIYGMYPKVWI